MAALYTAFAIKSENVSSKLTHSKFWFSATAFAQAVERLGLSAGAGTAQTR